MGQIYYISETAAAGILSVVSVGHPAVWSWFLIVASDSICINVAGTVAEKGEIRFPFCRAPVGRYAVRRRLRPWR